MYHKFLIDESFFHFLYKTDQDLAMQVKERACPFCQSPLHVSNYMRKPRGPDKLADSLSLCFSFSCSRDGCRRRSTPPSTRFLGRFVYWSTWVLLISVMANGRHKRCQDIARVLGIDVKTIKRWRHWWQEIFPTTKLWKKLRGNIMANVTSFPSEILAFFMRSNSTEDAIKAILQILKDLMGQKV